MKSEYPNRNEIGSLRHPMESAFMIHSTVQMKSKHPFSRGTGVPNGSSGRRKQTNMNPRGQQIYSVPSTNHVGTISTHHAHG